MSNWPSFPKTKNSRRDTAQTVFPGPDPFGTFSPDPIVPSQCPVRNSVVLTEVIGLTSLRALLGLLPSRSPLRPLLVLDGLVNA